MFNINLGHVSLFQNVNLPIWFQSVCNFLAVGPYTRAIPNKPALPKGANERHLLAIPSIASRSADKIHYFLFSDDQDLKLVFASIYVCVSVYLCTSHIL